MVVEGKKAPEFALTGIDEAGNEREYRLKDVLKDGRPVVLYFYPKDNTSGCTAEACDFRDNMARLKPKAAVLGVSRDSIKSHLNFRDKHGLNFPLLSDPEHTVHEAYGAWGEKKMYGKTSMGCIRTTVLIGADGKVIRVWSKVKVKGHVDEVMAEL